MYLTNKKSVALPVPELIGGTQKIGYVHTRGDRRWSGMEPFERPLVSSYRPFIHIIPLSAFVCPKFYTAVLSWGCKPPILRKGRLCGVGDGTIRKSIGEFL